jgi:hypothetical protein
MIALGIGFVFLSVIISHRDHSCPEKDSANMTIPKAKLSNLPLRQDAKLFFPIHSKEGIEHSYSNSIRNGMVQGNKTSSEEGIPMGEDTPIKENNQEVFLPPQLNNVEAEDSQKGGTIMTKPIQKTIYASLIVTVEPVKPSSEEDEKTEKVAPNIEKVPGQDTETTEVEEGISEVKKRIQKEINIKP